MRIYCINESQVHFTSLGQFSAEVRLSVLMEPHTTLLIQGQFYETLYQGIQHTSRNLKSFHLLIIAPFLDVSSVKFHAMKKVDGHWNSMFSRYRVNCVKKMRRQDKPRILSCEMVNIIMNSVIVEIESSSYEKSIPWNQE